MKFIKLDWGLEKFQEEYDKEFKRILDSEYGKSIILDLSQFDLDLPKGSADKTKLDNLVADKAWLENNVFEQNCEDVFGVRIRVHKGDLTADETDSLAQIADDFGKGEIRTVVSQDLIIPHIKLEDVNTLYQRLKATNQKIC